MKIFHRVMLALGIALFLLLLWDCGAGELWRAMRSLGWMLIPFVLLEGVADVFHSWGTRFSFRRRYRHIPLYRLVRIRLAGSAVNYVSPTAGVGGEVVKGALYERYCPVIEGVSALVIDKLSFGLAQLFLATVGGAVTLLWVPFPPAVTVALMTASVLIGAGMAGFLYFQRRGQLGRVAAWFGRILGRERFSAWAGGPLAEMDAALAAYYRENGNDLYLAIVAHAIGFVCGMVQGWIFLWTLYGVNSPGKAAAIWILGTWFDMAGFMIPAGLGIQEGSRMIVFSALGQSAAVGFAYSLALRIEQVFWTGVGFLLYGWEYGARRPAPTPSTGGAAAPAAVVAAVPEPVAAGGPCETRP